MRAFWRGLSGILLVVVLCTFTMWRNDTLPDLSGVSAMIESASERIDKAASAFEGISAGTTARPVDNSAANGENVYVEYELTEPLDASLEETICQGISELRNEIDISAYNVPEAELKAIMGQIQYSHPELYYLGSKYSYTAPGESKLVKYVKPSYLYTAAEIATMNLTYQACVKEIADQVDPTWSDFDKALFLHDYFVHNYCYDDSLTIRDAYRFFTEKTGVCQAYMLAMIAAGEAVGLEVLPVTSNAMMHAWNLVKIGGSWYHVDITWDDSIKENPAAISYRYFLQSDIGIASVDAGTDNGHRDWNTLYAADNTFYDAVSGMPDFHSAVSPIVKQYAEHYPVYFCVLNVESDAKNVHGAIYGGSSVTELTLMHQIKAEWMASTTSYYTSCYSGLCLYEGKVLYTTNNAIRIYDPGSGKDSQLGFAATGSRSIWGIVKLEGKALTLAVGQSPQDKEMQTMIYMIR